MMPNYYIMKLPGEKRAEFVSSRLPFTPNEKKNLMGLLVARNDGDEYGDLILYQMPKNKTVSTALCRLRHGWTRTRRYPREFSLWDSSGSKYSRGNMFVVPIEDSLLYIEPEYAWKLRIQVYLR